MAILKCTCQHEGQDKLHGKKMRVMNQIKTSQHADKQYRCTVCSTVRK